MRKPAAEPQPAKVPTRVKDISPEVQAVWPAGLPPLTADTAHLHRELGVTQGRVWNAAYVARKKLGAL